VLTREDKPLQATSIYAVTKKTQEELALCFGRAYRIPTLALRFFNVYGSRQALSNPYTGVAAIFLSRLKNGKAPLVFEDGKQSRDFIHVSDVARAVVQAVEGEDEVWEACSVCTGRPVTVAQVAAGLAARLASLGSLSKPAKYGAFEVASEKIAAGFLEKGWAVTVFCPHDQSYREPFYRGIALRRVWHPPGGIGSLLYDGMSLLVASVGPFDAILMFGYGAGPFFFIPRLFGTPLIVNTDGLEWKRSKWSWAVKQYFRLCERVVTLAADRLISDAWGIKRYYKETYGVDSEYIAYGTELPDAIGDDVREFGLEPKRYYLVVMRLEPENSILEIVRGYLASHSARPLILVGPSTPFFDRMVRPLLDGQSRARYL